MESFVHVLYCPLDSARLWHCYDDDHARAGLFRHGSRQMLSEILGTISLLTGKSIPPTPHANTAWTQLALTLEAPAQVGGELVEKAQRALPHASRWPEASEHALDLTQNPVTLRMELLRRNEQGHLSGLKRQPGQLSNVAFDEKQRKMAEFFGGGSAGAGRGGGRGQNNL
jgi:hypothetical protein